jgi:hypothetical protein
MIAYTVHMLDEFDAIVRSQTFESATESEAINWMLDLAGESPAELWFGDRKLLFWSGRARHAPRSRSLRSPWLSFQPMLAA